MRVEVRTSLAIELIEESTMHHHRILALAAILLATPALPAQAPQFPDGPGKEIVQTRCGICHQLSFARSTAYDAAGWRQRLHQMRNMGLPVTDAEFETVANYLAAINPERPRPAAVILPGPAQVSIREWPMPAEGAFARDTALAADGTFWISAQFLNELLHFDPRSGTFTRHKLPVFNSGPAGVDADKDGNIWYAANFAGRFYNPAHIGRFNPATGEFRQFNMPEGRAADPTELSLAPNGMIWFAAQNAGDVGRLDPATGEISFIAMPAPDATPFSIAFDSAGVPYVGLRDAGKIGRIDPAAMTLTEFALADPRSEPRRIAIGEGGIVWYTDIDRAFLGRLDPATGAVKEYASPSGAGAEPHGIAIRDGIVWYVEAAARPNTLVRFDPARESFQTFPLSGFATVREIAVTEDGALAFAMGTLNGFAMVEVRD